jgi:hypothetical protein
MSLYYKEKEKSKEVKPATGEKASLEATGAEAAEGAVPGIEAEPPTVAENTAGHAPETDGSLTIKAGAAPEAAPAAVVEAAVVADSCTAAADPAEAAPAAEAKAETEVEKSQAREKLFMEALTLHHQVLWTIMKQFKRYS